MYLVKRFSMLVLFSLAGAIIMYFYGWANLRGMFIKWTPLGKPPGNVVKVVAIDYVQSATGEIYQHVYEQDCNANCWFKSDLATSDSESLLPSDYCGKLPNLDNFVDSKVVCAFNGWGYSLTIEAIDHNGCIFVGKNNGW
jgi:hypothetical protein